MKLFLTLFFCFAAYTYTIGQPTIYNIEKFKIGDSCKYYTDERNYISPGSPGLNQIWDFSQLHFQDSETHSICDLNNAPDKSAFPTAKFVECITDISSTIYWYLNQTQDTTFCLGYRHNGAGFNYIDSAIRAIRPFSLSTNYIDTFTTNPGFHGVAEYSCDGYGTLLLPGKTINNVLRIKKVRESIDSGYYPNNPTHVSEIEYRWISNDYPFAVMIWDSAYLTGGVNKIGWKTMYMSGESLHVNTSRTLSNIQTRLLNNAIYISGDILHNNPYLIRISDISGKTIIETTFFHEQPISEITLDHAIPNGIYTILLFDTRQSRIVQISKASVYD